MDSPEVTRLVFGVVATTEMGGDSASFDALSDWMQSHAHLALERRDLRSYQALSESVRSGKCDLAWLPPVVYARLAEAVNTVGHIARGDSSTYAAALITLARSRFLTLDDLASKTEHARARPRAGWVDPWSAAGYVVPRIELARAGIEPSQAFSSETFYGSHGDVVAALARGDCDVAGTYAQVSGIETFGGAWSKVPGLHVHVISTFSSIPSDVIAARRTLAPAQYVRALAAFRSACASNEARGLVRAVFGGDDLREGVAPGHAAFRRAFERAKLKGLFD